MSENYTSEEKKNSPQKTIEKVHGIARLYRSTSTGIYYVRKTKGGRIFTRSLRTPSLATAKKIMGRVLGELDQEMQRAFQVSFAAFPTGKTQTKTRMKYREGLDLSFGSRLSAGHKYQTVRNLNTLYKILKDRTLPLWGNKTVEQISSMDVQDFLRNEMEGGKKPGTRNIYLSTLRRVFDDMLECDRRNGVRQYVTNPAGGIKRIPVKPKITIPETEVVHRVLQVVKSEDPLRGYFVYALLYTGARCNEMARLRWADIDLNNRILHCPNSKGKVGKFGDDGYRDVPMNGRAYDLFSKLIRGAGQVLPDEEVFPGLLYNTIFVSLKRACSKIGVVAISPHQLRHVFATTCIESGVDIPTIARWLGHSDGGVLLLKTYGHLRDNHSQAMAAKVSFSHD